MRRKSSWEFHRRNISTHDALEIDHDHQGNGDNLKQDDCDNPCDHIFRFAMVIHFYSLFLPSLRSTRAFQAAFRGWTWIWIRQSVAYRRPLAIDTITAWFDLRKKPNQNLFPVCRITSQSSAKGSRLQNLTICSRVAPHRKLGASAILFAPTY
jgi:hypothetical protein